MLRNLSVDEKVDTLLSTGQIPIIDLAHSGTDQRPSRAVINRVAAQLQKALTEKGIVFLVNHGICDDKMQTAWSYLDQFCDLPADTKDAYIRKDNNNHGYIKPGAERFNDTDGPELRHAFNICTLQENQLPEEPLPGFREHISELAVEFKALTSLLLQALAMGMDLEQHYFQENHSHMFSGSSENETTLRLLYYPPIVEDDNKCELQRGQCQYSYQRCAMDRPNLGMLDNSSAGGEYDEDVVATRCGAHCDYGTFTLLSQDSEGGLEVKLPGSGMWRRVGHLPGAILMNSGEILAAWTENRYPALLHRVIVPPQVSIRSRGRHSIAFFCHPDNCTSVEPLEKPDSRPSVQPCSRKPSFKMAKEKVTTAYHIIQKKFRKTYHGNGASANNGNSTATSGESSS